jgi:hypothetical protein
VQCDNAQVLKDSPISDSAIQIPHFVAATPDNVGAAATFTTHVSSGWETPFTQRIP